MTRPQAPVVRAILPVRSLDEVERLHTSIGGEVRRYDDSYAWVVRDGHELWHLSVVDGLDPASNRAAAYVHVSDPDEVHARLVGAGFEPGPVRDEPWGMREFAVRDDSGNLLRIGRNI